MDVVCAKEVGVAVEGGFASIPDGDACGCSLLLLSILGSTDSAVCGLSSKGGDGSSCILPLLLLPLTGAELICRSMYPTLDGGCCADLSFRPISFADFDRVSDFTPTDSSSVVTVVEVSSAFTS